MGETYRLEAEEETCEAAHKMRDELELQLSLSREAALLRAQPVRRPARQPLPRKPSNQRSRRT